MRKCSPVNKLAASLTLVSLQLMTAPVSMSAPTAATLSGTVFGAGGRNPLQGARVHAADPKTGATFSSRPTGPDGSFTVGGLPPARYRLAVEAHGGLYLVPAPLAMAAGGNRQLRLAIRPYAEAPVPDDDTSKRSKQGPWSNPVTATMIVIGAALVIGALIDLLDSGTGARASPSSP